MRRSLPSTQALACFEAAARHESYTRAAQELALTQSAVSRQITALEDFLGVPLFRRTRHGVLLTPAGTHYARQVGRWLQGLERDTLDVMAHHGLGGTLTLAAVPTFATRWLIPRLPQLAQAHPDIVVHIETRTRPFLFADAGFDAALYAGTPEQVANWPGTQAQQILLEVVQPVCSPRWLPDGRPLSPEALAQLPLLQQSTRPYAWRQWFEAAGVHAARALEGPRYELFSMAAVAAAHGMGVALIPPLLIETELARGELVPACETVGPAERAYYLVSPAQGPSPVLAAFAQWLLTMAAAGGGGKPSCQPGCSGLICTAGPVAAACKGLSRSGWMQSDPGGAMPTPHYHAPQFEPTVDELTVLKQLEMGQRATVTDALRAHWSHRLQERGFVSRQNDGALSLTSAGRALIRRQ